MKTLEPPFTLFENVQKAFRGSEVYKKTILDELDQASSCSNAAQPVESAPVDPILSLPLEYQELNRQKKEDFFKFKSGEGSMYSSNHQKKGVEGWYGIKDKMFCYSGRCTVNCPLDFALPLITTIPYTAEIESHIAKSIDILKEFNESFGVSRIILKGTWPLAPRDVLSLYSTYHIDKDTWIRYNYNYPHPEEYPPLNDYPRVNMRVNGMVVTRTGPETFLLENVSISNPHIGVPDWVAKGKLKDLSLTAGRYKEDLEKRWKKEKETKK